eukprot:TRINITY_DN834_c0_g1::TRINITY_DN834_c0_g1_i1::g.25457::m.25457 TRINITY_DN834_c0_g1::TRINITY_DN834_c0_g1_i1::g.25457  ORF type:complete len:355 (-),score=141.07,DIOX_N/PF14226.1/8.8e-08,2OG-FeII_Oxy/PF03171.15/0.065 TRINITY_DN834_c0_g1_i1:468-1532(-)
MSYEVPVIDLASFLAGTATNEELEATSKKVAECLRETGVLIVRDPRVSEQDNTTFLNQMEKYWDLPDEVKMKDIRPEIGYQVGATPENVEQCRCFQEPDCIERVSKLPVENQPTITKEKDAKWRFFWRIGERPSQTKFPEMNCAPVVPEGFPEWTSIMNMWGGKMLDAVKAISELAAVGFGLDKDAFTQRMNYGPHLLAPTGSNLNKHNELKTVFAAYHTDISFLTIHGKSRFPGLYLWLRDGTKVTCPRVPDGCLLVQAGKQLEYLTGGYVMAGFHEVIVTPQTLEAVEKAKAEGRSCWRSSSTLFSHTASDQTLAPLGHFATDDANTAYPAMPTGAFIARELEVLKLAKTMQ